MENTKFIKIKSHKILFTFILCNPSNSFSFRPFSLQLIIFLGYYTTAAVLNPLDPHTFIYVTGRPIESPMSMLFVIEIFPGI